MFSGQKISPDAKDKVQLQVVLNSSGANTFHFNNPGGRPTQINDRESVKELLQQMLSKFKRKMNSDLEEKNRYKVYVRFLMLKNQVSFFTLSCDRRFQKFNVWVEYFLNKTSSGSVLVN